MKACRYSLRAVYNIYGRGSAKRIAEFALKSAKKCDSKASSVLVSICPTALVQSTKLVGYLVLNYEFKLRSSFFRNYRLNFKG